MESDFVDIKITNLEVEMTVESPVRPPLRYVYFRISQTPMPIWLTYFDEQRKVSRHTHWRRAWVDRRYIVVECLPEEIEFYHLYDLKQDIAYANQRTRQYLKEKYSNAEVHKEHNHEHALEKLRVIKDRLNFD